jgi:hypothetical protein
VTRFLLCEKIKVGEGILERCLSKFAERGLGPPAARPVIPKPHVTHLCPVLRGVAEIPAADPLELVPATLRAGIEPGKERLEAHRINLERDVPVWKGLSERRAAETPGRASGLDPT